MGIAVVLVPVLGRMGIDTGRTQAGNDVSPPSQTAPLTPGHDEHRNGVTPGPMTEQLPAHADLDVVGVGADRQNHIFSVHLYRFDQFERSSTNLFQNSG